MLDIDYTKVCYVIVKAREFDVKVPPVEPNPGSNPTDDGESAVLEDYPDDPTFEELKTFLETLNDDEMVTMLALAWLGRGDYGDGGWDEAFKAARDAKNEQAVAYLLGIPLLSDYLEEGLSQLGYSCQDFEMGHL